MRTRLSRDRDGVIQAAVAWKHQATTYRSVVLYDPADPFAVRLRIWDVDNTQIDWRISRDVLREGLRGTPAGIGDYTVSRGDYSAVLDLSSPTGRITLTCVAAHLDQFLAATAGEVPFGTERAGYDVEAELAALLDGAL